jgi:hypothetical protein
MTITMSNHKIRIDLTEDQLRAALDVIGERVSATNESDTPLFRAERALDSALLAYENATELDWVDRIYANRRQDRAEAQERMQAQKEDAPE